MNHREKWLACGMGYAAMAFSFVACARISAADAYTALQIKQVQVLSAGDCSVPGTATTLFRDHGTLDLALPDGSTPPYYLPLLIVNNMASVGGSAAEEMNNITLTHYSVELSAPGISWGDSCPPTFDTQPMTITMAPGGSVGSSLDIIMSAHSQCLRPQIPEQGVSVTAKITAKGHHGGTSIESAPFDFTVNVCRGCLQTAYTTAALISYRYPANTPMCDSLVGENPYTGDACLPNGQDSTIFCCGVTQTVGATTQDVAVCPGAFTGKAADTSTTTSTSTSP